MRAVGLRSEFPIVFCAVSGEPPFLKTKAGGSATENPSCKHDRLRSIGQARCRRSDGAAYGLRHPTMACTGLAAAGFINEGQVAWALLAGDACRWLVVLCR